MTSRHKISLLIVAQLLLVFGAYSQLDATGDDTCWNHEDSSGDEEGQNCVIAATLYYSSDDGVPMDINCSPATSRGGSNSSAAEQETESTTNDGWQMAYVARRFEKVSRVSLNGCHTNFKAATTTYGIELLPNCDRIPQISVERFHMDVLWPLRCNQVGTEQAAGSTESLTFRHNEIATIGSESLSSRMQWLKALYFVANSLRHIERHAFDVLRLVEVIHIENEPLLVIKRDTADVFERCSVSSLRLIAVKRLAISLFFHLPESLRELRVQRSAIEGDVINVTNPRALQNITVTGCQLRQFHLSDPYASVASINVSRNDLVAFAVKCDSACAVETLDLSENKLTALTAEWFVDLPQLRTLQLRGNRLTSPSLAQLVAIVPAAKFVDLRDNAVRQFELDDEHGDEGLSEAVQHLRLRIDGNPLDCVWLLNFAHTWPERFRLFYYEKFISKINVNGLECQPPVAPPVESTPVDDWPSTKGDRSNEGRPEAEETTRNVTPLTLLYPNPQDFKRSQRSEALIIVFMLPLGIAFLFLLLYMWIYCQKVFHLSYYQTFPWGRNPHITTPTSAERFDVVRHLPPTNLPPNEGYEMPLNGMGPPCNCNTPCDSYCTKTHHITYEAIPAERPYKIYEDILEEEGDATYRSDAHTAATPLDANREEHQFYDHLSYME